MRKQFLQRVSRRVDKLCERVKKGVFNPSCRKKPEDISDEAKVDLRMTEVRHEFDDVVIENVHRHIGEKYCLEIFIAEGNNERILDLVGRVRGIRGIQQVRAMFMPL